MGNLQDKPESNPSAPNTPKHENGSSKKGDQCQLAPVDIKRKSSQESIASSRSDGQDSDVNEYVHTIKLNSPTHQRRDVSNQLEEFRSNSNIDTPKKYSIQIDSDQIESLQSILKRPTPDKRNIRVEVDEFLPSSQQAEPHRRNIRIEADQLEAIRTVLHSFTPRRQNIRLGTDNIESLRYILNSFAAKRQNIPRGLDPVGTNAQTHNRSHLDLSDPKNYKMRIKSDETESVGSKSGGPALNRRNIRIEFDKVDPIEAQIDRIISDPYYSTLELGNLTRPILNQQALNDYSVQRGLNQIEPEELVIYRERPCRLRAHGGEGQIMQEGCASYRQASDRRDTLNELNDLEALEYLLNKQRRNVTRATDQFDTRGPLLDEAAYEQRLQRALEERERMRYLVNNTRHNLQRGTDQLESQPPVLYRETINKTNFREDEPVGYQLNDHLHSRLRESDRFETVKPVLYRPTSQRYNIQPDDEPMGYTLNNAVPHRYSTGLAPTPRESIESLLNRELVNRQRAEQLEREADLLHYRSNPKKYNPQRTSEELERDGSLIYKQTPNRQSFVRESDQLESPETTSYRASPSRLKRKDLEFDSAGPVLYRSTANKYDIPRESDEVQSMGYQNNAAPNRYKPRLTLEDLEALKSSLYGDSDEFDTTGYLPSQAVPNKGTVSFESDHLKSNRSVIKTQNSDELSIRKEADITDSEFYNPTLSRHNK